MVALNAAADRLQVQLQPPPPASTASTETACAAAVGERLRAATFSTPSARLAPALESALAACDAALSAQHELLCNHKPSTSTSTTASSSTASTASASASVGTSAAISSRGTTTPQQTSTLTPLPVPTLTSTSMQVPTSLPTPTPAELTLAHNQLASLVDALVALLDECAPPAAFIERTRLVLLQAYKLIHLSHRVSSSTSSSFSSSSFAPESSQSQSQSSQSAASSSAGRTRQLRRPDAGQRQQLQAREQELEEQLRALVAAARDATLSFPAQEQRVALARAGQTCVLLSTGIRNALLAALN